MTKNDNRYGKRAGRHGGWSGDKCDFAVFWDFVIILNMFLIRKCLSDVLIVLIIWDTIVIS